MRYLGSKNRIKHQVYETIRNIEYRLTNGNTLPYFEPFCGSLSVTKLFVDGSRSISICDSNIDLILMYKALKQGWKPPINVTKGVYDRFKHAKPSRMRGYVGFNCAYNGKFFGGYIGGYTNGVQHMRYGRNGILDNAKYLKYMNILDATSYDSFNPVGMLIYCDPPYHNRTGYGKQPFDSTKFWKVMRQWSKNNIVIISEERAPADFKCIWKCMLTRPSTHKNIKRVHATECLFMYRY